MSAKGTNVDKLLGNGTTSCDPGTELTSHCKVDISLKEAVEALGKNAATKELDYHMTYKALNTWTGTSVIFVDELAVLDLDGMGGVL